MAVNNAYLDGSNALLTVQTLLSELSNLNSRIEKLVAAASKIFGGRRSELENFITTHTMQAILNLVSARYEILTQSHTYIFPVTIIGPQVLKTYIRGSMFSTRVMRRYDS